MKLVPLVPLPPLDVLPHAMTVPSARSAAKAPLFDAMLTKLLPPVKSTSPSSVLPQVAMVPSARSAAKPLGLE